ncbi:hypothetical protein MINTM008_34310 [Mycobacterium intracellulare]|nr:hypothetical protein MINTM008_34310 [Mycobacterium intracellulare]
MLDHIPVDDGMECGLETKFVEHQIDAVQTEGVFVAQEAQVGVPKTWAVSDDYTPLISMDALELANICAISAAARRQTGVQAC